MGNKLYVGNLAYSVRDESLQQAFGQFGTVTSAKVMMDRETGRSKGFGFVEMGSDAEAQAAINGMNGQPLEGRASSSTKRARVKSARAASAVAAAAAAATVAAAVVAAATAAAVVAAVAQPLRRWRLRRWPQPLRRWRRRRRPRRLRRWRRWRRRRWPRRLLILRHPMALARGFRRRWRGGYGGGSPGLLIRLVTDPRALPGRAALFSWGGAGVVRRSGAASVPARLAAAPGQQAVEQRVGQQPQQLGDHAHLPRDHAVAGARPRWRESALGEGLGGASGTACRSGCCAVSGVSM
jgi:hypothetical protein